jgi:hypothetical protein
MSYETQQTKLLKEIALLSHLHPQFHHILYLRATSEGSVTKVGLAIADKSGLTRWQENPSPYRLSNPAAWKPRDRTAHAARAKELGEDKGVADNGLTNTNTNILPTTNDDPRWQFGDIGDVLVSIDVSSALPD